MFSKTVHLSTIFGEALPELSTTPLCQLSYKSTLELYERLTRMGRDGLEHRLSRTGTIPAEVAATLAQQLLGECSFQLSTCGSGTFTVGTDVAKPRYSLFFEKWQATGFEKVHVPYERLDGEVGVGALPAPVQILLVNLDTPDYPNVTSPTGIVTLGGYLKSIFPEMVRVDYLDMQLEHPGALAERVERCAPDVVGLSAQIGSAGGMFNAIRQIKIISPGAAVIVGNVVATYGSDLIHHRVPDVMVAIGRGEDTIEAFTRVIAHGRGLDAKFRVPNSSFSIGSTIFEIGNVPATPAVQDGGSWRSVVPDWPTLFEMYPPSAYQEVWIEASRGCPQKDSGRVGCSFCSLMLNNGSRSWSGFPPSRVMAEVRMLAQYRVSHLRFADEEFMAGRTTEALQLAGAMRALHQELDDAGLRMPTFDFAMRVDDVHKRGRGQDTPRLCDTGEVTTDNEIRRKALASFKAAGLTQVYLGIESGSLNQLKRMYKAVKPEDNRRAIEILRQLGIRIASGWIMIDPLMDTIDDLKENLAFLEECKLVPRTLQDDFVTNPINRMRVLEGSPMVDLLRKRGLLGERRENLIEYEFLYKDPQIAAIADLLSRWEDEVRPLMYALKTKVGAALLCGRTEAEILSTHLLEWKRLDFEFVKAVVALYDSPGPPDRIGTDAESILAEFRQKRERAIEVFVKNVAGGNLDDSAGTLMIGLNRIDRREPGHPG